jgi:filamentous hemagglutinin
MRKIWLSAIAVFTAVFAAVVVLDAANTTPPSAAAIASQIVWSNGRDGAAENAQEHWEKHGGEFPQFRSAEDYERAALDFVRHPPPGTLEKHHGNGDTLLYQPSTNTFAVEDTQGEPRTFFRPNSGRAYWDRQ